MTLGLHADATYLLAAVVSSSDDVIIGMDNHGVITSWNPAAERILGHLAAEAIGQSMHLVMPPELRTREDAIFGRLRGGETIDRYDTERLHKDGRRIPVAVTVSAIIGADGEIIGGLEIARDISQSKRLERDARHLAAIVESSDDAIVSKDLNGIVISWNGAAEQMFGFSAAEMAGQSIRLLIPGDRQPEEDDVLSRIRRGERVEHYETVRRRKDGSAIPVSLTVSPIRNADGKIIGASKIVRDISDRKRAEEERQRLLSIANDASRLKDEFLATLSHELRTPLNVIVGYTHMLKTGLLQTADKQRQAFDVVSRSATSLTRIVEDVLDVSRIVSGKLRLDVQAVELAPLVARAIDAIRPAAEAKGLRIRTTLAPGAVTVSGDAERIQQILWNLCSNAVKFTERGGHVDVRLERASSHVAVVVSDTGIGIEREFLPHVFERFSQADGSSARVRGGLGLGLAISRHLVELQGARIFAKSEGLGKGSTFRVEFPIERHSTPAGQVHARTPEEREELWVPDLAGVHVLAVDDDHDALSLVREIIESTGAEVLTADSGTDALKKLEGYSPDVLLADLSMPHMDGFELIDRVRQSDDARIKHVPALALTAYARSEDRAKALRNGFQRHLSKPIQPGELMAAIGALSGRTNPGAREGQVSQPA
jgi:PAS domain S-box-containing protein